MDLHRLQTCASTQDEAFAAAAADASTGTAFVADVQTGGRGSRGQRWASSEGGLWLSVLLRPTGAEAPELASIRAGLAIAAALRCFEDLPSVQLKWPNDLLVHGKKIGGVLVEAQWSGTRLEAMVVGLGLNVRNAPPPDARWPAARLADWLPVIQVDAVLHVVLPAIRGIELSASSLTAAECHAFATRNALHGITIVEPVSGIVDAITPDGQLRVRQADGRMCTVRSGPIVPVALPASA